MSSPLMKLSKEDLIERLDVLQEVAVYFLSESDRNNALQFLLQKAMELCPCDGATFYLLNKDQTKLNFEAMLNSSFETERFKSFGIPLVVRSMATHTHNNKEVLNVPDVYLVEKELGIKFNDALDRRMNYRTRSMLTLPLLSQKGESLGVIQLVNRKNFLKEKWPLESNLISNMPTFSKGDSEFLGRLSSLAVASLDKWFNPSIDLPTFKEDEDFIL